MLFRTVVNIVTWIGATIRWTKSVISSMRFDCARADLSGVLSLSDSTTSSLITRISRCQVESDKPPSSVRTSKRVQAGEESEESPASLQTVQAVVKYPSLSRSKVYQLMERGDLTYVKIGKSRRLRWSDVVRLVDESVVEH